ncbi:hypothetical protein LINPERHAP1_LOCUS21050 [Linum perenne]
MASGA